MRIRVYARFRWRSPELREVKRVGLKSEGNAVARHSRGPGNHGRLGCAGAGNRPAEVHLHGH